MKKTIALMVSVLMLGSTLTGCIPPKRNETNDSRTESSTSSTDNSSKESSEENSKPESLKIGETAKTKNWEITVNSAEVVEEVKQNYGSFKPEDGSKYLVINVSVKNISKDPESFLPSYGMGDDIRAKIKYQDYDFSSTNLLGYSEEMHDTILNPLSSKTGIIAFALANEVTENLNELHIVFYEGTSEYDFLLAQ